LRFFCEGGGVRFPVEEVCGGKGLVDEYPPSLYLTILVIMHWALDLPGASVGGGILRRGGVFAETGWMPQTKWVRTSGRGVGMGSIGLREVRGVEAHEASRSDFIVVTVPRASSSNVGGKGVELGASGRGR
jgi:hypothetical protein